MLRAAIAENAVERHLPLLRGVPFLARTGDADQTVSAYWARRATRILSDAGGAAAGAAGGVAVAGAGGVAGAAPAEPAYSELRGKQHWWWDTQRDSDGGALHDDEMRAFFAAAIGPPRARAPLPALPGGPGAGGDGTTAPYVLTAHNPGAFLGRAGWRIVQTRVPARGASVSVEHLPAGARGGGGGLRLATANVRRLEVPAAALLAEGGDAANVSLDGARLPEAAAATAAEARRAAAASGGDAEEAVVALCRLDDGGGRGVRREPWAVGPAACGAASWAVAERGPETAGPMRQTFLAPFAIVVGAGENGGGGGDDEAGCDVAEGAVTGATLAALGALLSSLFVITSEVRYLARPRR